jgi:hypothetical protein
MLVDDGTDSVASQTIRQSEYPIFVLRGVVAITDEHLRRDALGSCGQYGQVVILLCQQLPVKERLGLARKKSGMASSVGMISSPKILAHARTYMVCLE